MRVVEGGDHAVFCLISGMPGIDKGFFPVVLQGFLYKLPGGKKVGNEMPEETAVREIGEEIGCQVKIGQQIYQKNLTDHDFIIFLAEYEGGEYKAGDGVDKTFLVTLDEMRNMSYKSQLFPQHAEALREILMKYNLI